MFKPEDPHHIASGLNTDWPAGRGIFVSSDESMSAWINEGDMLRLVVKEDGQAMVKVFNKLAEYQKDVGLDYQHDDTFGFVAICPTNIGTGM